MRKLKKINPKLLPECNIGMVGHVAHGKTTIVNAITGQTTLKHSEELKRGITIRLGYADASIYLCPNCNKYSTTQKCPYCFSTAELKRTVSFVDAPGHETLMATVLTGTSLMDGAILVIAANEKCPQPQTIEHLSALEAAGIENVIIVQNKIDLVSEEEAIKNYEQIKNFIKGTMLENSPIIPISAQHRVNIDALLEAIQNVIPTPKRESGVDPLMFVARSFDINKPGTEPRKLVGGVLGGSLVQGKLKIEDEVEIKPGVRVKEKYHPMTTRVVGLQKAKIDLEEAGPGGLLGVLTELDPCLTKSDALVGNLVGLPDKLPPVHTDIRLEVRILKRILISKESFYPIQKEENILINIGTARTLGMVTSTEDGVIEAKLKIPVCTKIGEKAVISRQIAGRWRLIGYGVVL